MLTYLLQLSVKGIQVDKEVDSHVRKGLHTSAVVGGGVNMVHAYGVGIQFLHQLRIAFALCSIDERIKRDELIGDS